LKQEYITVRINQVTIVTVIVLRARAKKREQRVPILLLSKQSLNSFLQTLLIG
jgi:hypothetical protein